MLNRTPGPVTRLPSRDGRPPIGLLTVWYAMVTGWATIGALGYSKLLRHRYQHVDIDVLWMAPVAYLIFFAAPGLILALVARVRPRWITLQVASTVLGVLAFLSIIIMPGRLHISAQVLLATGLAVLSSRILVRHSASFLRVVRRTVTPSAVMILLIFAGLSGWQRVSERRAIAAAPRPAPGAPNVLLIILDTVRAMSLSLYGYDQPTTPRLEDIASRGVRFDNAIAPSPWTLPTHASIMTGRWVHELNMDWRTPLDGSAPTIAEELGSRGYLTAGFAANTLYTSAESGLSRGFIHYEDFPRSGWQIIRNSPLGWRLFANLSVRRALGLIQRPWRIHGPDINRRFLRWLDSNAERPFFVFLNYYDAHAAYDAPPPFSTMFGPTGPRSNPDLSPSTQWSQTEVERNQNAYNASQPPFGTTGCLG